MTRFSIGFALGLLLGTATAAAAAVIGGSGYLMGWDVTLQGHTLCSDPYVWSGTREIECD